MSSMNSKHYLIGKTARCDFRLRSRWRGGGGGTVKRNRSLDRDMSMIRALDEFQHQDSLSRVEISHTWQ